MLLRLDTSLLRRVRNTMPRLLDLELHRHILLRQEQHRLRKNKNRRRL
jgi:hypothetical protein